MYYNLLVKKMYYILTKKGASVHTRALYSSKKLLDIFRFALQTCQFAQELLPIVHKMWHKKLLQSQSRHRQRRFRVRWLLFLPGAVGCKTHHRSNRLIEDRGRHRRRPLVQKFSDQWNSNLLQLITCA